MRVLFLDDDAERKMHFAAGQHGNHVVYVKNYEEAVEALESNDAFDVAHLDHDLMDFHGYGDGRVYEFTGLDVVKYIVNKLNPEQWPKRVIVHSWNPAGAKHMAQHLQDAGIPVTRAPFAGKKID